MEHEAAGLLAPLGVWLEGTAASAAIRRSLWAYPVASVVHVLGVGLLLGAIVALDLRLLGLARTISARALARLLIPLAATGVIVQIPTGAVMLLADAAALLGHPLMLAKLLLVGLALGNVLLVHRAAGPGLVALDGPLPPAVRRGALLSLLAWPTVAVLGRAVAYL
ncbi:MAG: hypothetical protein NZ555_10035 [Geminicoccaceae bacterium]|nr:hypothetical protein [Geminicoccaceae bacterium]MCX8100938.1 hypothetical protein [Geminicoccaceae bacterium]MDW8368635.1 hypothetical protein [Geminicoccaceae bacterium]